MGRFGLVLISVLAWIAVSGGVQAQSGSESCGGDEPCHTALGEYHSLSPPGWDGQSPLPAILHFHGGGSSGRAVVNNKPFVEPILARGYAVLAPTSMVRPGRTRGGWSVADGRPPQRDEVAFAHQVIADAQVRFHIDPARVLVTGFSRGASLVWDIACVSGPDFAAYAPIAGGFWRPHPSECAGGPVQMFHAHGFTDTTVPLEGRPLRGGAFAQGDIFEGLQLLRQTNGCGNLRPDEFDVGEPLRCRIWTECTSGAQLEFCVHDGGHMVPAGWADRALDWFEALPG